MIRSWRLSAGLPEATVNAITQTRDGFLWVGTNGGLGRFDGNGFRNYGLLDGLRSIWILALAEDRQGTLWIGTVGGGLSRWKNGVLSTCGPEEGFPEESDILTLAADADGSLWIGTERGLWHRSGGKITPAGESQGLPQGQVREILTDSGGTLWVSVLTKGLYRRNGGKFEKVEKPAGGEAPGSRVYSLAEVPGGAVLAGSQARIWRQSGGGWEKRDNSDGVPDTEINALSCSPGGVVWAGARGAGLYREYSGKFEKFVTRTALDTNSVLSLFEDRQGLLWAGTAGAGLFRLAPRIMQLQGAETGLPASIMSLAEDGTGTVWAGTIDGVYRWNGGKYEAITSATDPDISGNPSDIYCIARAADGSIWAAGESRAYRFDPGRATTQFTTAPVAGEAVRALCAGGNAMWMGTYYGALLKGDASGVQTAAPPRTFPGGITCLAVEAEDTLWVGTSRGVHRWAKGNLQTWTVKDGLLSAHILALHRDPDGTVWLGTLGGGLARMRHGKFFHFTTRQGLIENTVSQIVADDHGCLWLAADRGLMRLERGELEAVAAGSGGELAPVLFGHHEGLLVEQCAGGTSPNAIRTKAGRLLFPAGGGIAAIDPNRLQRLRPPAPPQSSLVDVVVDREPHPVHQPLVIPPGSHRLEISYTAPLLQGGDSLRFRYKLDGLDNDWLPAVRDRKVSYDALAPGHYVFQVATAHGSGNWTETPATLAFTVQPFYWQTVWFRLLTFSGAAALAAGLAALYRSGRRRRRAERRAHEREMQIAREELAHVTRVAMLGELSGSLAHELNQPLAAVLSNAQAGLRFLVRDTPDLEEMKAILVDIADDAKRAGGIIHGMRAMFKKDTRQEIHPVEINDTVQQVLQLLHSECVARQAETEFTAAEALPSVLAGKVELMQVLINLVLNSLDAMKEMSGPRRVRIGTAREKEGVSISVRDSGPGIAPEVAAKLFAPFVSTKSGGLGMGLAISRSIVERFGGRLTAENHPQGGALFCILLPPAPGEKATEPLPITPRGAIQ